MPTLIVALSPQAAQPDHPFVLVSSIASFPDGTPFLQEGAVPPSLLPRGADVVLVVPPAMLSWHRVILPKVNHARVRAALIGLLEERLLDEPQDLHFALAPGATPGTSTWVAACNKNWLSSALQTFEAAGLAVLRVVPEYVPLVPDRAATVHFTGSVDSGWMVRCDEDGVQRVPLIAGAQSAPGWSAANDEIPQVFAEPALLQKAEQLCGRAETVSRSQALVHAALSDWNLAQFDLASTGRTRCARRSSQAWTHWTGAPWRPVRWTLTALIAGNLVGLNAWAWKERSALEDKRSEANMLLTQTFPKIPVVVNAPLQMEREVAALRRQTGSASSRDLEPMLVTVAALSKAELPLSSLDYADKELTLKGLSPSPEGTASLAQGLANAGYASVLEGDTWVIRPATLAPAGLRGSL